ncbi:Hpt sensor hybrid histidine kinase [Pseudomonas chlororaphis]|uniref:ATP-binding protein n=1 Tax=Pseudomonas chlororaphis TaxID=587753 RepID=UPI00087B9646|nr:ATP-binding protein [Pseudomonas chlororaphis]AZD68497.1 Hybrid sensory histidine kinase EvgS [Pseudomonas chlororaphis subsp. aurantiaca]QIT24378.1 response regulator [Pseudomonas chlororaphis subsp. aurantiaca]WDH02494.1 ATP-binding protein [Pseudomonas chlororaphis]WDH08658.1 ATP-binding protein [Pseudomonas chlororaphis]SDS64091.1 Hpt sensor hybrid histidine kinase [Pseudomonas chlororaphis]
MFKHISYYLTLTATTVLAVLFLGLVEAGQRESGITSTPQCTDTAPCLESAAAPPLDNGHRGLFLLAGLGLGVPLLASLGWNAWLHRRLTRQQQAAHDLGQQLAFMQAWIDGVPHPTYVRDRQGLLQSCNASYLESLAAHREALIGKTLLQSVMDDPGQAREYHADYQHVMAQGRPLLRDRPLRLNGQELTVQHWVLPYRDANGEVRGIIGGWVDISERHRLSDSLEAARQQAEAASRAKSAFLASTSHELRRSMNALIGALELLQQRSASQSQDHPVIEMAYRSARTMQALVDDTLDIARIESGSLALNPEWLDPRLLVEAVVSEFDSQVREKHLKLLPTFHSSLEPVDVLLDPLRFRQVLGNLLHNAIRFTEQGQIRVHLDLQAATQPQQVQLMLQVTDSGIGIDEQDQHRLFEPFFQAQARPLSRPDGAGLGLTLCRHLCEFMQGTLQLASQPGIGTEVRVLLPLACQPRRKPAAIVEPLVAPATRALNVLVIDDHAADRLLLSEQLHFLGHRCRTAEDVEQGFELWSKGFFDLLIVNCHMPGMNGYELIRAIRERERLEPRAACRILGMTASPRPQERQQCEQAGIDDCLFKPVSLATLRHKLAGLQPRPWNGVFSLKALRTLSRGKPQFALRILTELLHCSYRDRQQLMALPCEPPPRALAELAHKIKGSALMVQAKDLEAQCEALEQAVLEDADRQTLTQRRTALEQAMLKLERALLWQIDQQPNAPLT